MKTDDVRWLHVEPTSKCNAWCPACPRNKNGYGLQDWLVEEDLPIARFTEIVSQLPNLSVIHFCGNLGDPIITPNIIEFIKIAKKHSKKIQIHTNGSLRSATWWKKLAELLSDIEHDVWFGIDGLAGVHEIYRQNTSYEKIIKNAQAFISNGGYATWQFIPYEHNMHQLKNCISTSQKLGFKNFKLAPFVRSNTLARHYKTGEEFRLIPPKNVLHFLQVHKKPESTTVVDPKNCLHLDSSSIYLSASGKLSSCCFFSDVKTFDSLDELLYNDVDLTHSKCLASCGTKNEN